MSTRIKFLLLIFTIIMAFCLSFFLFISTDVAKKERAYFKRYPYQEMAARQKMILNEKVSISSVDQPNDTVRKTPEIRALQAQGALVPITKEPSPITRKKSTPKQPAVIERILPPQQSVKELRPIKVPEPFTPTKYPPNLTSVAPKNSMPTDFANLGYQAYDNEDYQTAISYFDRALLQYPDDPKVRLQLAYSHKVVGNNAKAVENFKNAINHYDNPPFHIKREIEQLENRFDINGYVIYRNETTNSSAQVGADLTQSQAGAEISYQPKDFGFRNGRKFQIYGRFLTALQNRSLTFDPDSYQAGIGVRLKPLSNQNLILSVERLLKVGNFARNDWMVRAGYSFDHGTDYREDKSQWWSYSFYLDAAFITLKKPDIFLTGQFTGGYSIKVTKGFILQPRFTVLTSWQKDPFRQASLSEAGPGLNLRYYFNDTKYEAYRSYIDLTLEYRHKLSGNSIGSSGPIMSLLLHF